MNKIFAIQADIVGALSHIEMMGKTKAECQKEVDRLNKRISTELSLVRERFACTTLITSMLCVVNQHKMCLAYEYKGKLYSTAHNVKGMANTDVLHDLGLPMAEWDKMPKYSVWIASGNVYDTVDL